MPTMEFTDRALRAIRPQSKRVESWDVSVPGPGMFGLRVTPAGTKTWVAYYRIGVTAIDPDTNEEAHSLKNRRLTIGQFPTMGLADARDKARKALAKAQNGEDPAANKRQRRVNARHTVQALFDAYATHAAVRQAAGEFRSWGQIRRSLERDVLPEWGQRPARSIRRKDVHELVTAKAIKGPTAANRLQAHISMLFSFGCDRDWIPANPAAGMRKTKEQPREHVLSDDDLRAVWGYLDGHDPLVLVRGKTSTRQMQPATDGALRDLFKVLILTGQRLGETSRMAWAAVDLDARRWVIPATETKNGREHAVPLTADVLTILQRRRDAAPASHVYVFATDAGKAHVHMWAKRTAAAIARAVTVTFTAHDLRRTLATRLGDLGTAGDTIDAILNHARPGVLRHYDHSSKERLKRDALDRWAAELQRILRRSLARSHGSRGGDVAMSKEESVWELSKPGRHELGGGREAVAIRASELARTLTDLLASGCEEARSLKPEELRRLTPLIPKLAEAISKHLWFMDVARAGFLPFGHPLDVRRKRVQVAVARMDRLRGALADILPFDLIVLRHYEADLAGLDHSLSVARERCLAVMNDGMRGTPGRLSDTYRPQLISSVRAVLEHAGVRCRAYRDGLFAAVVVRVLMAAGEPAPQDVLPLLRCGKPPEES